MLHKITEGDRSRTGLNLMADEDGKLIAISVYLSRRFHLCLSRDKRFRAFYSDLTLDHKMYRPNDMDNKGGLVCRRCGEHSSEARPNCRGRTFMWIRR